MMLFLLLATDEKNLLWTGEIAARLGSEIKVEFLQKRCSILVSQWNDSFYTGNRVEITGNQLILPQKLKNRLHLDGGDLLKCRYYEDFQYAIIHKVSSV